ncbi:MAG: potassium channel protein [Bacteroidota bacterium]
MKSRNQVWLIILIILSYVFVLYFMYVVESAQEDSNIKSFTDAFWYSLVTLTTVGYGDFYPVTAAGRILSLFFIFGSLGLLGILIGNMTERYNTYKEYKKMGYKGTEFTNHVIILGWDSFAHSITGQLLKAEKKVAIVTNHKDDIDLIYDEYGQDDAFVLFSDPKTPSMLDRLNLEEASMIFVNLENDTDKLITILNLKKAFPHLKFTVILDNSDLKDTFTAAGVSFILSKNEIAAKLVASYIFEPDVANYTSDLLSKADAHSEDYDIQQYMVLENNPFVNKTFGDAFLMLKSQFNVIPIGIAREEAGKREIHKIPDDSFVIKPHDYLIMILNGTSLNKIRDHFGIQEGVQVG